LSVPFTPPSPIYIPLEEVAKRQSNYAYQLYFASPESTIEIERNLDTFLKIIHGAGGFKPKDFRKALLEIKSSSLSLPSKLTENAFRYYHEQFQQGMNGPLSYYRTTKVRYDEEKAASLPVSLRPDLPVLFLYGDRDPTCIQPLVSRAGRFIPCLQNVVLQGRSHWLMLEVPELVTQKVIHWLDEIFLVNSKL